MTEKEYISSGDMCTCLGMQVHSSMLVKHVKMDKDSHYAHPNS